MALIIDFHVLAQAVLYFFSAVCGLVVSIPVGVTTVNFKSRCVLYTDVNWQNATHFKADFTSYTTCNFPVYLSVFAGILYALGMGIYYVYALTRKDPNIGSQMWVLPFTMMNSLVTVAFFISACIISVGLKSFCDGYRKNPLGTIPSCRRAQKANWDDKNIDGSTFYDYLHAAEVACWVMFLDWAVQLGLGVARIVRNRRQRSQGMYADSPGQEAAAGPGGKKPEDMANIATVEPTA